MFQIIINIISAILGLRGSTVDPMKDSARLQGLYLALGSALVALCGHYMPQFVLSQDQAVQVVTAAGYVVGFIVYAFGAVRATTNTVGGYFRGGDTGRDL
jgi:hypothetical protein